MDKILEAIGYHLGQKTAALTAAYRRGATRAAVEKHMKFQISALDFYSS